MRGSESRGKCEKASELVGRTSVVLLFICSAAHSLDCDTSFAIALPYPWGIGLHTVEFYSVAATGGQQCLLTLFPCLSILHPELARYLWASEAHAGAFESQHGELSADTPFVALCGWVHVSNTRISVPLLQTNQNSTDCPDPNYGVVCAIGVIPASHLLAPQP